MSGEVPAESGHRHRSRSIPAGSRSEQRDGALWYAPQRECEPVSRRCARRRARRRPASSRRDRRHAPDPAQALGHRPRHRDGPALRGVHRGAPARGVSGPRRPRRGERRDRRAVRVPLGDRSPRRHHELRARRADLRGLGRARARGRRRAGRRLRPEPGRVLRGRAGPRGDDERRADPRLRASIPSTRPSSSRAFPTTSARRR